MGERVTGERMARALAMYGDALERHGWRPVDGYALAYGRPYGHVFYVFTRDGVSGAIRHDVPGFTGSGGSGAVSLRELCDRVWQSARVIGDLDHPYPVDTVGGPAA
jgi:hypothetical protein